MLPCKNVKFLIIFRFQIFAKMVQLKLGFFADYGQQSVSVKKYWAILLSQLREWITQGTRSSINSWRPLLLCAVRLSQAPLSRVGASIERAMLVRNHGSARVSTP